MEFDKIKKQWEEYNEEFDMNDFMDVDTHVSMAMKVGILLNEIERLTQVLESNNLPVNACEDCGKEEKNPGLSVCGSCYSKRIFGNNY